MLTLLAKSKRTHARYITTHTKTTAHKLHQATRRLVLSFSALAVACMPLLSLPANAQSSITGLSTTSGPSVGGTEVTLEGEVKASFKQVSAGDYHSLGLTNDGAVYAWGNNSSGQLGDGTTTQRTTPTLVTALSGQTVTAVAAGHTHSLALTSTGAVYVWGYNYSGQLGDGTTTQRTTPTLVTALSGQTVIALAAGYSHSLALTSTGAVYAWGDNWAGQLGDDTTTQRTTPTLVTALSGQTVTAVAGGGSHSLALTSTGAVYAWGYNNRGQLGDGTTTDRSTPTLVTALSGQTVTAVAAGISHSLALTSTGAVYAWGDNWAGQLGDGTTTQRTTPTLVTALSGQTVTAVAGGGSHSLALTSTGAVYAWGYNSYGQLGDGTTTDRSTPTLVTALSGQTVTAVAAGSSHSLALTSTGAVYAWGDNYEGQLGDGTTTSRTTPTLVTALSGQTVTAVAAGNAHSLALTSTGAVYAWGDNYYGRLGDGTTTSRTTPTLVTALSGQTVTAVAAGSSHSLALTSTGAVYAWGYNYYGQLGDGTTTSRTTPTLVTALSGQTVTAVAGGYSHSLALTSTGAVYAWGASSSGQLGDGTTTQRTTPTLVTALSGQTVTAVAAGSSHSLALTSTGVVYAWGANSSGQLGDGTTTSRTTPTLVTALSGQTVTAVAGGFGHSLALTSTGAVYAWGANGSGQLGDGTTTSRTTPTLVTALSGQTVTAVAAGTSHSLALTSTGAVYAWGYNYYGQLGDGTAGYKTTPATIASETVAVPVPTVTFGGLPATNVQIVDGLSGKELKATTPAHAPGVVDVVITFPGETPITLANAYTYLPTTTVELSGITHPDPNGIAPALASGSLLAAGACNNITEPSVALLSPTGASAPADVSLYGGVGFSLSCTSSGEAATISIALTNDSSDATASLPAITSSNLTNLRAYKSHSGTLTDITDQATFALGAGNTVLVSYQLVDGGELDEDGVANGIIVDPVYIGYYLGDDTSGSGSLAETGSSTLLLAVAGVVLVLGGMGGVYVATTRRRTQFSR